MDIEKLIEQANRFGMELRRDGGEFEYSIGEKFLNYATALSTLQAENEKLRAELDDLRIQWDMYGGDVGITAVYKELEQVKRERDAAVALVHEWEEYGRYLSPMGFTAPHNWRND